MERNNLEPLSSLPAWNQVRLDFFSGRKLVWGRSVYVCALRLDDGELLVVISPDSTSTAISDYGKRWGMETLFGMFKTVVILS